MPFFITFHSMRFIGVSINTSLAVIKFLAKFWIGIYIYIYISPCVTGIMIEHPNVSSIIKRTRTTSIASTYLISSFMFARRWSAFE